MGAVARYDFEIQKCEQQHTEMYCRWWYNFNHWPNYPMYKDFREFLKDNNVPADGIDREVEINGIRIR